MAAANFSLPQPGEHLTPIQTMQCALDVATQGIRSANPLVGAVICDDQGKYLCAGWHRGAGSAHAEADAIAQAQKAGIDLSGAHMFVTLEPCHHQGRTGPCSEAIAQAGIKKLSYAYADETEQAAGGADYLRSVGLEVDAGLLAHESYALNARWFQMAQAKRPWVTAKIASTLDGFIAADDGTSQWITGPEARADGHRIRERAEAILVGTQTVIDDNPQLTARDIRGDLLARQPLRVVMGQRELNPDAAIFADGNYLHLRTRDPQWALDELASCGIKHLMIEGGARIISAFLAADLVDEIFWYQAPKILGSGKPGVHSLGRESLSQASTWLIDDLGMSSGLLQLGSDLRVHLTTGLG